MENFIIDKSEVAVLLKTLSELAEPSFKEYDTTKFIIEFLKDSGIPIDKKFPTGCFGTINIGAEKTIALRADIDALPLNEEKTSFAHLCGHHAHTASLLYALKLLNKNREKLKTNVRYIFQPAEETGEGALFMLKENVMENVDEIYALHGDPNTPIGVVGVKSGELMAGASLFKFTFSGKGTHAAFPHKGNDIVVALSDFINLCQKIISRMKNPVEEGLISFCKINGGTAPNILPSKMELEGTIRFFNIEMKNFIIDSMSKAAKSIENFYNIGIDYNFSKGTLPLKNSSKLIEKLIPILEKTGLTIKKDYEKMMGSEDFSYFLEKAPGVYLKAGIAKDKNHPALHQNDFFVPIEAVINFVKIFLAIVS